MKRPVSDGLCGRRKASTRCGVPAPPTHSALLPQRRRVLDAWTTLDPVERECRRRHSFEAVGDLRGGRQAFAYSETEISTEIEVGAGPDFSDLVRRRRADIENATIADVQADAASLDWDAYETYDEDTLLVRATVDAEVEIEGYVFKADYYAIDEDVSVVDFDWNDHYALVTASLSARLVFQLRVEAGARLVENVEFETAEACVS